MENWLYVELGKRIRSARIRRRWTQADLAQRIDISRTSLTNVECGRQRLLVDQLSRIAEALEVSLVELVPPPRVHESAEVSEPDRLTGMPTVSRWLAATKDSLAGGSG